MRAEPDRRTKLLRLAAGAAFLAIAAVVVLIVVNAGNGSGGDVKIEGAREVNKFFKGIPQHALLLGSSKVPVELIEYGDLQCPVCRGYSEDVLPSIIEDQVRQGKVKLDFRTFAIIGDQSVPAGAAAWAAGEQGRGWNYIDLFYRNQGEENSGYADDAFLEAVAKAAGVKDLAKWNKDREELVPQIEGTTEEAEGLGFEGTPSFAVIGPKTKGIEVIDTPASTEAIEAAVEDAQ